MGRERLEFFRKMREDHPGWDEAHYIRYISHDPDIEAGYVLVEPFVAIGVQGFGYERNELGEPVHCPQVGGVRLGDGVMIHAFTTIARATLKGAFTEIGRNTAIDCGVHIGHNAQIGENCILTAHCIIGGSSTIGDNTFIGLNAVIRNKVKVGRNCLIGQDANVVCDVPDNQVWMGNPAKYARDNV